MAKKRPKVIGGTDVHAEGGISRDSIMGNDVCEEELSTEKRKSMIKIGKEAPDFELSAFHKDKFTTVKLSDFRGKWVLLCFYPGDFTFV